MVFKYNHIDKNYVEATMKSVNVFFKKHTCDNSTRLLMISSYHVFNK